MKKNAGSRSKTSRKKAVKEKTKKKTVPAAASEKKTWSLYILECDDHSLYTGISNDVAKRFANHCAKKGARYTKMHPPVSLLYVEECGSQGDALKREREVKTFPRKRKLKLIADEIAGTSQKSGN